MTCPSCGHSLVLTDIGWVHALRSTDCSCECDKKIVEMAQSSLDEKIRAMKEAGLR